MPIRLGIVAQGIAHGRSTVALLSGELERARIEVGLSYSDLGRAVGLSGEQAARICRGQSTSVSVVRLAALMAAVGRKLSCRSYPAGPPIRDAAHLALLSRLKARVDPTLSWHVEVPVVAEKSGPFTARSSSQDLRAWDATVSGDRWTFGVEAETRLGDMQSLTRRVALKARDGEVAGVLLLVNETAHNRRILAADEVDLTSSFPGSARTTLHRLGRGLQPSASTVLVL